MNINTLTDQDKIELSVSQESNKTPDTLDKEFLELSEEANNILLSMESALEDLKNPNDIEVMRKYDDLVDYDMLTQESGYGKYLANALIDASKDIVATILLYLKKLYSNGMVVIKKMYIKFIAYSDKQHLKAQELMGSEFTLSPEVIIKELQSFVNEYGAIDSNLVNMSINTRSLEDVLDKLYAVNNVIALTMPNSKVMEDLIEKNDGPLSDMHKNFRKSVSDKYNEVFNSGGSDAVFKNNLKLSDIKDDVMFPYVFASDGKIMHIIDMNEDGKLLVKSSAIIKHTRGKLIDHAPIVEVIKGLAETDFRKIVANDIKIMDRVKKDSEAYLNQAKKYVNIDSYIVGAYGNNVLTTMNVAITFSKNRMALTRNILNIFEEEK